MFWMEQKFIKVLTKSSIVFLPNIRHIKHTQNKFQNQIKNKRREPYFNICNVHFKYYFWNGL